MNVGMCDPLPFFVGPINKFSYVPRPHQIGLHFISNGSVNSLRTAFLVQRIYLSAFLYHLDTLHWGEGMLIVQLSEYYIS